MESKEWGRIKKTIPMVDFVFPWVSHIIFSFIPTFFICMAGESMVGIMKEYLPMNGIPMMTLFTVGTLLPTVGVAILCKQVITKPLDWVTFAFGFILAGALGLNLIAVVAVFFAVLNYQLQQAKNVRLAAATSGNVSADDEEEEDI